MIRIKTIHIEEFRGIRQLDLDLAGKNFGICGPNGTGKSGVVDAIEFCLTGDVTRLSGQGTADLSVKNHAPHVDQRKNPDKAKVTIRAAIPSVGKDVTITRSVKNPKAVEITPADKDVEAAVKELQTHPEFALSRREIAKYIITPPGQRSVDVQTLLRLDHIENLRKSFRTFANKCKRDAEEAERARGQAEGELKTALGLTKLNRAQVLEKANEKRRILDLPDLTELTPATSFKDGAIPEGGVAKIPALAREVALADLAALKAGGTENEPDDLKEKRDTAREALQKLKDDDKALILARQHGLITTGLELITEGACPLCDKPWDAEELRAHLKAKLLSAQEIAALLETLHTAIDGVLDALETRLAALKTATGYCDVLEPAIPRAEQDAYAEELKTAQAALKTFLEDYSEIDEALAALGATWWTLPSAVQARLEECEKAIKALPASSAKDGAREFLAVLQDRYERLLSATRTAKEKVAQNGTAQKILGYYNEVSNRVLETIYDQVAKDFSKFYRAINHEDEDKFVGELIAEPAKLTFNVDFYGRGPFPPGAYHSEGHQDAMGLCLYLALMKHTLGDKFTFAVLDDVLMSVDTGHRRDVCRLLKTEFQNTQLILTTHDRVWLQYMKTEKLIERSQLFGGWSVDLGPRVWDDQDIWTEIKAELDKSDVARAAWLLRRYLEYIATVLADNLRARIEFRGDAQYDLGDLLPSVLKEWRTRLEDGEKAAEHWGHAGEMAALAAKRAEAKTLIGKSLTEQWTINPAVHFNEWANFGKAEFQAVVDAFKALLEHIRCANPQCGTYPYVAPKKGPSEALRCSCGAIQINLKSK
jgi:recombinational DNA repair ATPase RecF